MTPDEAKAGKLALDAVRAWAKCSGDLPAGEVFVAAVSHLLTEWQEWRAHGMDIVATAIVDEVAEIVKAMRDMQGGEVMSERKVSAATQRINDFIDGIRPAPGAAVLKTAAYDALCDWHNARQSDNREAAAWAVDGMRNIADVMQDILDGRGEG